MRAKIFATVALHLVFIVAICSLMEFASREGWLNPLLYGRPSGIAQFLWVNAKNGKLWGDLGFTLAGMGLSFALGSICAILFGLVFAVWPAVERLFDPYFSAINAMPRIALAPLFIIWFGIGIGSKVAVGASIVFFIVLSSTIAGIRGVSQDYKILCATLGASGYDVFVKATLPSAVPVLFSGLRLGLIYALLGVIGAEMIASDRGLGQSLSYLASTFNVNGVLALLLVLAAVGVAITRLMTWIELRLLHWQ